MNKPKLTVTFDWLEFTVLQAQLPAVMEILDLKWENFSPLKVADSVINTRSNGPRAMFSSCITALIKAMKRQSVLPTPKSILNPALT